MLDDSAEMYLKCAACEKDEGFKANFLKEAALVVKSIDSQRYVQLVKQTIEYYQLSGRTS